MGCVVEIITGYLFPQVQRGVEAGFSFLQNLAAERILNLVNLGKNARTLAREMKQLAVLRDDLLRRVENEEVRPRMQRTCQVEDWIKRVEELDREVGDFQASFEGRTTLLEGCSFGSVFSNYELGQKAADKLGRVGELRSQGGSYLGGGGGGELVTEGPPDAVVAVPSSTARIVGGGKILSEIRRHLKADDDGVGIIGIYGMGGVGKTTYLTAINNEFLTAEPRTNDHFEVVIWVTVGKDVDISRIQEDIGLRLGFSRPGQGTLTLPPDPADRRNALSRALGRKPKFLLLLDDLWEKLDLVEETGIPRPPPESQSTGKVVFTTRWKEVCTDMEAQKMFKVDYLDEKESWELFSLKVGAEVDLNNNSSPSIRRLAEEVVRRCGGLPLALVTAGHAMAGAVTISEWEDAVAKLREAPEEVRGMEKKVLSILKFSFDKLRDDSLRHCLLYCSLYPEDHEIDTGELVDYWVGEGFLDAKRSRSLDGTRRKGREVISSLKAACLLESAGRSWRGVECVKMHDVVRDMALWLTNGEREYGTNVLFKVDPGGGEGGSIRVQNINNIDGWERATRISFFSRCSDNDDVELLSQVPTCPNLQTLLLGRVKIKQLACRDGFIFKFMPALRVLDLSYTSIEELPKEIGLLVGLQYLNLQRSHVRSLPRELGNLAKLRQLNLRYTNALGRIPGDAILRLAGLQMLDTYCSGYGVICESLMSTETGADDHDHDDGEITLEGMERALGPRLEELGIAVKTSKSLEVLVTSSHLSKCTRSLSLAKVSDLTASQLSRAFERLEGLREMDLWNPVDLGGELSFGGCNQLQYLEVLRLFFLGPAGILVPPPPPLPHSHLLLPRLRDLQICYSHGFKNLTWIQHLPCLERVVLVRCHGLEELLLQAGGGGEQAVEACSSVTTQDNSFPNLKDVRLGSLPRLRILSEHPLLLPSLEELSIVECPELKKLPFGAHSAKKLRAIQGPQEWWDGLEWGGHDSSSSIIKDIFLDKFWPLPS